MIDERDIRTFVNGTTRYFEVAAQQPASLGSPYLATQGFPDLHEFTGVITVSGRRHGVVYFTAPRGMLTVLLMRMNERSSSLRRRAMSSRICACTMTSSAVVGSSPMTTAGSQASAIAIIARWRMPPDSSWG